MGWAGAEEYKDMRDDELLDFEDLYSFSGFHDPFSIFQCGEVPLVAGRFRQGSPLLSAYQLDKERMRSLGRMSKLPSDILAFMHDVELWDGAKLGRVYPSILETGAILRFHGKEDALMSKLRTTNSFVLPVAREVAKRAVGNIHGDLRKMVEPPQETEELDIEDILGDNDGSDCSGGCAEMLRTI